MRAATRPRTKARGYHENGYKLDGKTPSLDMCPYCVSFHCDPGTMSHAFSEKIRERRRKRLCTACGEPEGFCRCKSSGDPERIGRRTGHSRRKLLKARAMVAAREKAYGAWRLHEDALCAALGDDAYGSVLDALYRHERPAMGLDAATAAMEAIGADPSTIRPAWTGKPS